MTSLLLDIGTWDLTVDFQGNIALAGDPYATAQDVACALRLFQGELWYDTSQGVPYLQRILGRRPPLEYLRAQFVAAALTVPSVATAEAFITGYTQAKREVTGQVQVTLTAGARLAIATSPGVPWYVTAVNL